jgi:putative resolvase
VSYIPLRKAVEATGLHKNTLRKYADNGTIKTIRNAANQRLFSVDDFLGRTKPLINYEICYCRVSSSKQRDDLDRQVAYMHSLYPNAELIRDIGSGLNFKRKGLQTILERLMRGDKFTLIVAECSPWCFNCSYTNDDAFIIKGLVEYNGGKLITICVPKMT